MTAKTGSTKTKANGSKRRLIIQTLPLLTLGVVILCCDLHPTTTSVRRSLLESGARSLRYLQRSTSSEWPKYGRTFGILKQRALKGARDLTPDRKLLHDPRKLAYYNETTGECTFSKTLGPTEIPPDVTFENTIVVGYPGGDKRTVLRQMEALTELSGRDAWDYEFLGMTSQPYIKTNYPHHEGIWGWQDHADHVILIVRNIRQTIDEYHDILADIDYAKTWEEATEKIPNLYNGYIDMDNYAGWRDERVMDEIGWYGWVIDYWMESGLMRDYFDHKVTTPEHFEMLREPETYTYGELQWDVSNCAAVTNETTPLPLSYDPHCTNDVSGGCEPVMVMSAERLLDPATGYDESRRIANYLSQTPGVQDYLIQTPEAWDCLYDTLIVNNPDGAAPPQSAGYHDLRWRDSANPDPAMHPLSTRMLTKMVEQLTRLINKYSAYDPDTGIDWTQKQIAIDLVDILTGYRAEVQADLDVTPSAVWTHAPHPHWVIFPMCGESQRFTWDFSYPHLTQMTGYM